MLTLNTKLDAMNTIIVNARILILNILLLVIVYIGKEYRDKIFDKERPNV